MTKQAAFGTTFGIGTLQVETCVVVGTIVDPGNATFTLTHAGMAGSPLDIVVAVLAGDTASVVATKAAAAMNLVAAITTHMTVAASGPNVVLTILLAEADDGTLNLAYTNTTCTGLTPDASSNNTTAGVAYVNVAYLSNIGGPGLGLDTIDVTTHDTSPAWEEVVPTILRSGEVSLDLIYDPAAATHSSAANGLLDRYVDKTLTRCKITFPDTTAWIFSAYVTGFEPSEPTDGALTAAVKLKVAGVPVLV